MRTWQVGLVAALAGLQAAPLAHAADPPPGGIVGQDVMGDKGRSGPDGWSWAPVTRDRAANGDAAGQAAANGAPNAQPDPGAGKTLPPGEDPGTPVKQVQGPGALDKPETSR